MTLPGVGHSGDAALEPTGALGDAGGYLLERLAEKLADAGSTVLHACHDSIRLAALWCAAVFVPFGKHRCGWLVAAGATQPTKHVLHSGFCVVVGQVLGCGTTRDDAMKSVSDASPAFVPHAMVQMMQMCDLVLPMFCCLRSNLILTYT